MAPLQDWCCRVLSRQRHLPFPDNPCSVFSSFGVSLLIAFLFLSRCGVATLQDWSRRDRAVDTTPAFSLHIPVNPLFVPKAILVSRYSLQFCFLLLDVEWQLSKIGAVETELEENFAQRFLPTLPTTIS